MRIGIEIELHGTNCNYHDVASSEGFNFKSFVKRDGLEIKMSREYYNQTIEFNFKPHLLTQSYIKRVAKFIKEMQVRHGLKLSNRGPAFVGTHIHIFDMKYRKLKSEELLQTTMYHVDKGYDKLLKQSKKRLFSSHQLWGYYSQHHMEEHVHKLIEAGMGFCYPSNAYNNKKYCPYLVSDRSDKGKPRSVEIRVVPNEFLFNGKLYDLLLCLQKEKYNKVNLYSMLKSWMDRF